MVSSANFRSLTDESLDVQVVRVEREEQWGENTALRSSCADRTGAGCVFFSASLAAACLSGSY